MPPQAAFERLLHKYERLIYHVAYRYFGQAEDAMDASQEAAIRIFKGLPSVLLPPSGSLKSWVCAITANVCVDILRKRRLVTEALPEWETTHQAEPSAEENALANERVRDVLRAIDRLSDEHRFMIIMRDMNALTYQEIAQASGITEGTVKSRLSRARAALKQLL
jgi:RNA polymerase sigma-70 factor (ECF subfamily)